MAADLLYKFMTRLCLIISRAARSLSAEAGPNEHSPYMRSYKLHIIKKLSAFRSTSIRSASGSSDHFFLRDSTRKGGLIRSCLSEFTSMTLQRIFPSSDPSPIPGNRTTQTRRTTKWARIRQGGGIVTRWRIKKLPKFFQKLPKM